MFIFLNETAKTRHLSVAVEMNGSVVHKYSPNILLLLPFFRSYLILYFFLLFYLFFLWAKACDLNSRTMNRVVIIQNFLFFDDYLAHFESGNF